MYCYTFNPLKIADDDSISNIYLSHSTVNSKY